MMATARRLAILSTATIKCANSAWGDLWMLSWLRKRRELVAAEADEFMEAHGNNAYFQAREEVREARKDGDHFREKFLAKVCIEIAKRTDFEIGLDTATRYLEEKQAPYDPGPGIARKRPDDATLH